MLLSWLKMKKSKKPIWEVNPESISYTSYVGKSTLMNLLVGERISIATFKSQTTRHRIMGILNTDDMQIVFSDTPGVVKPSYKLQESMLNFSESALADADVLLYVTDVVEKQDKNSDFIETISSFVSKSVTITFFSL